MRKVKYISTILFVLLSFYSLPLIANTPIHTDMDEVESADELVDANKDLDTDEQDSDIYDLDEVLEEMIIKGYASNVYDTLNIDDILLEIEENLVSKVPYSINPKIYETNPLLIDLVFKGYGKNPIKSDSFTSILSETSIFDDKRPEIFSSVIETEKQSANLQNLRFAIMRRIAIEHPYLIAFQADKLPDVSDLIHFKFKTPPIEQNIKTLFSSGTIRHQKIAIEKVKYNPWHKESNSLLQLSQSYISSNWHQGGTSNTALLGILNARLNYDDKKKIQWENFFEWRMGFNTVDGDTLRLLNTNDDIIRAISKLGVKASGNWYYSGSVDFSTLMFKSYKGVNSTELKTNFLTPTRMNVSVGFDYKHKKLFSLMLSPLSYKYVYANDTIHIDQKSFGIPAGQMSVHQIGSSFRAQLSYKPFRELEIDSRLNFFTNYEKIEVDWEIVGNFKFNRYLSTRLAINPRYDNSVLTDEAKKVQFKQLLTIGFSYRLL